MVCTNSNTTESISTSTGASDVDDETDDNKDSEDLLDEGSSEFVDLGGEISSMRTPEMMEPVDSWG